MKNIAAKRKIFLIISAAAMVLVVLVAVVMGPSMGLELGGGTVGIYAYSTGTTLAPADFENTAEEYLGEDVTVQELDNLPTGMTQLVLTVAQGFTEDTQQGLLQALTALDDAGLVLAELAQNFGSGNVNCSVHVLVGFFYADDVAACAHGNLALSGGGVSRILFDLQYNLGSKGVDVHDLHGVADFFFGISADGIRDGHPAAGDGDFHDFTSQTETNFAVFRGAPHETGMPKTTIHAVRDACWMHLCSTFCNGRWFRISPRQPSSLISLAHFFLISSIKMNLF